MDTAIQCHRKEGLLVMQFLVLVKNDAELGPHFNEERWQHLSPAAPCCSAFTHSAHFQPNLGLGAESLLYSVVLGYQDFYRYKELELKPKKTMSLMHPGKVSSTHTTLFKIYLIKGWIT